MKALSLSSRSNRYLATAACVAALTACGGGGGGGGVASAPAPAPAPAPVPASSLKTGVFIDAVVQGLPYQTTSGQKGKTGAGGEFKYNEGDTVSFTLGDRAIGSAKAAPQVYLWDLQRAGETVDGSRNARENLLAALLLSLDADGNAGNGIQLKGDIENATGLPDVSEVDDNTLNKLKAFVSAVAGWNTAHPGYMGSNTTHWNTSKPSSAVDAGSNHLVQTAKAHATALPALAGGGRDCLGFAVERYVPVPVQGAALAPDAALEAIQKKHLYVLGTDEVWDSSSDMCGAPWSHAAHVTEAGELRKKHPDAEWLSASKVTQALSASGVETTCRISKQDPDDHEWMSAPCILKAKVYPGPAGRYVWVSEETITAGDDNGKTHRWSYSVTPEFIGSM